MADIASELKIALRRLLIATITLYGIVAVGVLFVFLDSQAKRNALRKQTQQTNRALCVVRHDLEKRIDATKQFLRDNPKGIPGIPPATLKAGLENQEATVRGLSRIDCR